MYLCTAIVYNIKSALNFKKYMEHCTFFFFLYNTYSKLWQGQKSISNVFKMSSLFINENGITFGHNLIPLTSKPYVGKVTENVCLFSDTS